MTAALAHTTATELRGKAASPWASPARASRLAPAGMGGAVGAWLPDGRLHLQHGPIDLICLAEGPGAEAAFSRGIGRFDGLLQELVAELPALRSLDAAVTGETARLMARAVAPFRPAFITPMAAVAGAVAQTVLAAMAGPGLSRLAVNNGGDIALWLAPGEGFEVAMATQGAIAGHIRLAAGSGVAGIATSGWRGRSWSLGIADAVTVLAPTAAMADAAATMVANAVDLPGHPAISRTPAWAMQADSDLCDSPVTTAVGPLSPLEVAMALDRGLHAAEHWRRRGLIHSAALHLCGQSRLCGALPLQERRNA